MRLFAISEAPMFWVGLIATILIGPWVLFALIGVLTGAERQTSRTVYIAKAKPRAVWKALTKFETQAQWREEIKKIEKMPKQDGHEVWRETLHYGPPVTLATTTELEPELLVREICDPRLPFTGSFTYELEREGSGTRLRITESMGVRNVVMRGMARIVGNQTESVTLLLTSIAKHLGEKDPVVEEG